MGGGGTDEELVRRAQRGDRAAFDELVVRHRDRVYAVALRLTRNPADAEDALQDTFLNAYRALGRFGGRARVSTWLYRIAANASYDVISRRRGRDQTIDDGVHEPVAPGDPYVQDAQRRALERALAALPDEFREAVVLCDVRRARRRRGGGAPRRTGWYGQVPGVPGPRAARRRAAGTRCPRSRRNPRMSDNPGMPEHDEPSAAELDRVRALLAGLGEEPAPPAVVARLERVLESQLPAAGAAPPRRRRRWLPGALVGGVAVAAVIAGALVVSRPGDDDSQKQSAAGAAAASTALESARGSAGGNATRRWRRPSRSPPPPTPRSSRRHRPIPTAAKAAAPTVPTTPEEASCARRRSTRIVRHAASCWSGAHHDRSRPPLPHLLRADALRLGPVRQLRRAAARRRRRQPRRLRAPRRAVAPGGCDAARPGAVRRPRRHRAAGAARPDRRPRPPRPAARRD